VCNAAPHRRFISQRREGIVQAADTIMQVSNDAAKEFDKSVLAVMMKVTP
jgi:hypothetical protein